MKPAPGYTMPLPEKDEMFNTKCKMLQNIIVSLGGRVVEELIYRMILQQVRHRILSRQLRQQEIWLPSMASLTDLVFNYASSDEDEVFIGRDLNIQDHMERILLQPLMKRLRTLLMTVMHRLRR